MTVHAPIPDYAAARESMVDTQLRPEGVNYPPVVEAMAAVPREDFVAPEAKPLAYIDRTVPIGDGRLMNGPVVLGKLLTEMTPLAGERALVVGCGTGYSAAVLRVMGLKVIGLESSSTLAALARGAGIHVAEGPLEEGWPKGAPYDLILIDGAVEHIPEAMAARAVPARSIPGAGVSRAPVAAARPAAAGAVLPAGPACAAHASRARWPAVALPR